MSQDPTVEAIFVIRFSSRDEDIVSDLLKVFSSDAIKKRFPARKGLSTSNVPASIRRKVSELSSQPAFMLQGDNETLLIGDQVFGFSARASHVDGSGFAEKTAALIEDFAEKKERVEIEQAGYQGIGLIAADQDADSGFDRIHFQGKVAGYGLSKHDMTVKFQVKDEEGMLHTIQLKNSTTLTNTSTGEEKSGLFIDIFTGMDFDLDGLWSDSADMVKRLRAAEKSMLEKVMKGELPEEGVTGL